MTIRELPTQSELNAAIAGLSKRKRLAFALACAERLYPNYLAFVRDYDWRGPQSLRKVLDSVWRSVREASAHSCPTAELLSELESVEPETEDFSTPLVSAALDAVAAAELVLRLAEIDDVAVASQVASLCLDTVQMYARAIEPMNPTSPGFLNTLLSHHLVQDEIRWIHRDLGFLSEMSENDVEFRRFEELHRSAKVGNLGL
jgi:uncharacterized protein YjaG (DUF416 family)